LTAEAVLQEEVNGVRTIDLCCCWLRIEILVVVGSVEFYVASVLSTGLLNSTMVEIAVAFTATPKDLMALPL